jgi:hypothetical protein
MNKEMKMNKITFAAFAIFSTLIFSSCEEDGQIITNDFEDVTLGEAGYWDGSDKRGELVEGSYLYNLNTGTLELLNSFTESQWGGSWRGFAISSLTDSLTGGWFNQYSTIAGHGAAGSQQFALVFDTASIYLPQSHGKQKPVSVMITNSTYAYFDMLDGSDFSDAFEDGDWFKVVFKGFDGDVQTGKVEFYLADCRDGKNTLVREWTEVNLRKLGQPELITIGFESSDVGEWGINTPKYVCLDNFKVSVPIVEK